MHNWWLPKERLGDLAFAVRAWGLTDSFLGHLASNADPVKAKEMTAKRWSSDEERAEYEAYFADLADRSVEVQVFDFGDRYMVRALAPRMFRGPADVDAVIDALAYTTNVDYDDRSDVPDEELANKPYARMLDALIRARRYVVIETFSVKEFQDRIDHIGFGLSDERVGQPIDRLRLCDGPCGGHGYVRDDGEDYPDCPVCGGRGVLPDGTL